MTIRPVEWFPLSGSDPIPGDPAQVMAAAAHYRDIAERIANAAQNLRAVAARAQDSSDAVSAFRERAIDVSAGIVKAKSRYSGLAAALDAYAPPLEEAQAASLVALLAARQAQGEARAARSAEDQLREQVAFTQDPIETAELNRRLAASAQVAEQADSDLSSARNLLAEAIARRDAAAETAVQAIDDVETVSEVRDSHWDKFRDDLARASEVVLLWVEEIGKVLDKFTWALLVLQIVLMFIPGVNIALAVLVGVVRILSTLSKVLIAVEFVSKSILFVSGRITGAEMIAAGLKVGLAIGLGKYADRIYKNHGTALKLEDWRTKMAAGFDAERARRSAGAWAGRAFTTQPLPGVENRVLSSLMSSGGSGSLAMVYGSTTDVGRRLVLGGTAALAGADAVGQVGSRILDSGQPLDLRQVIAPLSDRAAPSP